jgi:hypothetical protein
MKISFGSGKGPFTRDGGTVLSCGLQDASMCTQDSRARYHWLYIEYFAPSYRRLLSHIWES